jgi:hypothetical protein
MCSTPDNWWLSLNHSSIPMTSLHAYPVIVGSVLHRNSKAQMAVDLNTKPLEEWIQEAVKQQPLNTASADEMDL